jgi:DNA-binding CsgD family transcriptional regulator
MPLGDLDRIESLETYIRDRWYERDERHRGVKLMKHRGIVDDLDLFSPDEINRHPYYQEFLAPHRLRWFGGIGISCANDLWCLSIQRTIDQEPFSESEKKQLAKLSKRLSSTVAIASAIGGATAAGALDAFEISGRGAALIDRQGKIFKLNKVAEQLLTGDIRVVKGRLVANDSEASTAFERTLNELLHRPSAALRPPIAFSRKGRHPVLAYPTRLSSMTRNVLADCQAMVIFVDTEVGPRPPESALQMVFHLTDAEARLAASLASGDALDAASERHGIAKETSRSQLKSIFAKTGCHRQSELVAMLSTFLKDDRKTEPT